jgi:hypothetical protein
MAPSLRREQPALHMECHTKKRMHREAAYDMG